MMWRVFKGYIPTDEVLKKKGLTVVSKCQFCNSSESIHHIFFKCNIAWRAWCYFAQLFNVHINYNMSLSQMVRTWLISSKAEVHITHIIPPLLFWSLWEARNASKYREEEVLFDRILNRVMGFLTRMAASGLFKYNHWQDHFHILKQLNLQFLFKKGRIPRLLRWNKPEQSFMKLNVDGSRGAHESRMEVVL